MLQILGCRKSLCDGMKDMQATAYRLLGFDEHTTMRDQQDRPYPIAGDGRSGPNCLVNGFGSGRLVEWNRPY